MAAAASATSAACCVEHPSEQDYQDDKKEGPRQFEKPLEPIQVASFHFLYLRAILNKLMLVMIATSRF
jgi:hypothetical protein